MSFYMKSEFFREKNKIIAFIANIVINLQYGKFQNQKIENEKNNFAASVAMCAKIGEIIFFNFFSIFTKISKFGKKVKKHKILTPFFRLVETSVGNLNDFFQFTNFISFQSVEI